MVMVIKIHPMAALESMDEMEICFTSPVFLTKRSIVDIGDIILVFLTTDRLTTSISLENGTTITIPTMPGTQIDVAAVTIYTAHDKNIQIDADVVN